MRDDELSELIRQQASYHKASPKLRADVSARMALLSAASREASSEGKVPVEATGPVRQASRLWRPVAVAFAAGVLMTVLLSPLLMQWTQTWHQPEDADLVAEHVHALKIGPLIQVASSDRHTVKPWFQGKIDYAPMVLDLADDGFVLSGGRVERVHGEAVAVLVYTHHQHILNLFVWPTDEQGPPQMQAMHQHRGFHVLYWHDGGMRYALVSDMDGNELARFEQAWRNHRPQP